MGNFTWVDLTLRSSVNDQIAGIFKGVMSNTARLASAEIRPGAMKIDKAAFVRHRRLLADLNTIGSTNTQWQSFCIKQKLRPPFLPSLVTPA